MICHPQRDGVHSVNETPEHPARLLSLPSERWLAGLASWRPTSRQQCRWVAGLGVRGWGLCNLLGIKAALSKMAKGEFLPKADFWVVLL